MQVTLLLHPGLSINQILLEQGQNLLSTLNHRINSSYLSGSWNVVQQSRWSSAIKSLKWSKLGGSVIIGFEPKLSQIQLITPLRRSVSREGPEIMFQTLVNNLSRPISLRMVSKRHCQSNTLEPHQLSPKLSSEHRVPIRN